MAELALIFCSIAWAAGYLLMKILVADIDPAVLIAYRYLIGAICIFPFIFRNTGPIRPLLIWGSICGAVLFLLLYPMAYSLIDGSATNAGFIIGLFVAIVPVLSYLWYGTRLSAKDSSAVVLSVIGLWVLTGGVSGVSISDLLMLASALASAFHVLFIEYSARRGINLMALGFVQCMTVFLIGLILALSSGQSWHVASSTDLSLLLFLGVVPSGICIVFQLYGQKNISAWKACLIYASEPVTTAIMAHYTIGEAITVRTVLGGTLIIFAMILPGLTRRKLLKPSPEHSCSN